MDGGLGPVDGDLDGEVRSRVGVDTWAMGSGSGLRPALKSEATAWLN